LTSVNRDVRWERHYSAKAGKSRPMDMEWAKDGETGLSYLVQARPETVPSQRRGNVLETYDIKGARRAACDRTRRRREDRIR